MATSTAAAIKPLTRAGVSQTTAAIYDLLADGAWHDREDVLAAAAKGALTADYTRAVEEGKRVRRGRTAPVTELAASGSRYLARNTLMICQRRGRVEVKGDKIRMPKKLIKEWLNQPTEAPKPDNEQLTLSNARQRFGEEQSFGGIAEFDGWAYAPLKTWDVAYVRPHVDVPLAQMRDAFPGWTVAEAPDGRITVSAPPGSPVKDAVAEWLDAKNIAHDGVRASDRVRRRSLRDLPPAFLEDLAVRYADYARRRLAAQHAMSMQRLVGSSDDEAALAALWVLECAEAFDAEHGVPFGAYLTRQLAKKVQDLNRSTFGRTAADAELRRAQAVAAFETEHHRSPTQAELRPLLGLSPEEMRRKETELAHLRGLRATSPLDTGPDAPEIPVIAVNDDPERDAIRAEEAEMVSRALLVAAGEWDPATGRPIKLRPLGFLVTYLMYFQDWTRGDLTAIANRAPRVVNSEVRAVQEAMARSITRQRDAE